MTQYMYLTGVAGSYAKTPDSTALSITGDIDIRCYVAAADWTPAASYTILMAKLVGTSNQRSWSFCVYSTGKLALMHSADGSTLPIEQSSVACGLTDGTAKWLRVTRTAATGVVKFYMCDDGSSWSQLGSDVAGTSGGLYDSTAGLEIGSMDGGGSGTRGLYYRAIVKDGIGGTVVFDADFGDRIATFAESSSNAATVTIYGRPQGYEPAWLPAEALYGNATHYGYEAKKLDAPEPAPKTTYPSATGGTTYPVVR